MRWWNTHASNTHFLDILWKGTVIWNMDSETWSLASASSTDMLWHIKYLNRRQSCTHLIPYSLTFRDMRA